MKPKHPRHPEIPADFIFIGHGGTFEPSYKEKYRVVEGKYCFRASFYSTREDYANGCSGVDYYVKKNGPTHILNGITSTYKTAVKKSKYTVAKHGISWVVNENGGIFGHFATRKIARKAAKALNQFDS